MREPGGAAGIALPESLSEGIDRFNPKALRAALGSFATGVTILTTRGADGENVELAANSFSSLSLNPPMVLWSLAETSTNIEAFRAAQHFAVHILAGEQEELSARFACRTAFQYESGDHTIFICEIGEFSQSRRPLVFHGGRFGMLFEKAPPQPVPAEAMDDRLLHDDLLYQVSRTYYLMRQDALEERQRRGWTEEENTALNILVRAGTLPVNRLHELGQLRRRRVTPDLVADLVSHGLLDAAGPIEPESQVRLTASGRTAIIGIIAMLRQAKPGCSARTPVKCNCSRISCGASPMDDLRFADCPTPLSRSESDGSRTGMSRDDRSKRPSPRLPVGRALLRSHAPERVKSRAEGNSR